MSQTVNLRDLTPMLSRPEAWWFWGRDWEVFSIGQYLEARKPGRVDHRVRLEPYETFDTALLRLRDHVLEAYPGEGRDVATAD
ncbi:MAG: hypothetical protein SFU83_23570 [Meiothermus sp.]|nr:hypothetical protein [Meiothermus sp.]